MSNIYKYMGGSGSQFTAFLNAHKAGTFLNSCTISGTNDEITITKNSCSVTIHPTTTETSGYITYTNGSLTVTRYPVTGSTSIVPTNAILCKNGVIITFLNSNESSYVVGYLAITTDSNGELSAIMRGGSVDNANAGYTITAMCGDSSAATSIAVVPSFNQQITTIAPAVIATAEGTTNIPNFFYTAQSAMPALGLSAVRIVNTDYITNGYFFIKAV